MEALIKYLRMLLEEKIGIDSQMISNAICKKILQERMKIIDIEEHEIYFSLLRESSKEFQAVVELIVVPETWFFRDRESIDFMSYKIYGQYIGSGKTKNVTILSVACSTGEEAYSFAMSLADLGMPLNQISIHGIDISEKAIAIAESGSYNARSFRNNTNLVFRDHYFKQDQSSYTINKVLKDAVKFSIGNVFDPLFYLPYQGYDFIFCRNLLIYLNVEAQKKLVSLLNKTLKPGGYLFTAPCEAELIKGNDFIQQLPQKICGFQKIQSVKGEIPHPSKVLKEMIKKNFNNNNSSSEKQYELDKAKMFANVGYFDQSMCLCLDYITKHGINPEILFLLGLIHHAKGNDETAEDYFQKTLYLDPYHHEALVYMSLLTQKRGDHAQAERLMSRAEQAKPGKAIKL